MGCGASKAAAEAKAKEEEEARLKAAQAGAGGRKRGSVAAQGGIDPTKMKVDLATLPKIAKSEEAVGRIKACIAQNILFKSLSTVPGPAPGNRTPCAPRVPWRPTPLTSVSARPLLQEYTDAIIASMKEVQVKKDEHIINQVRASAPRVASP